jgi:DNA-binding response OmpR family regulator
VADDSDRNARTMVAAPNPEQSGAVEARSLRHDLKTPLNQIIGYSEMLQEDAEELGQTGFVADLKKIETAGRTLLGMIDALDFVGGRVQASKGAAPTLSDRRTIVVPRFAQSFKGRLLVVDDDAANRDMLGRRLQARGATVKNAESGEKALAMLAEGSFDLVVLDVVMPGMSGLEVLEKIREQVALDDLPVIMATARDASEDIVQALERGANDYVTKPLDFSVVLARVATQLALKRARDRVRDLNHRLEQAHQRIADLAGTAPAAFEDVKSWIKPLAAEVADAIEVPRLSVFLYEDESLHAVTDLSMPPPGPEVMKSLSEARGPSPHARGALYSINGPSGRLFGCLFLAENAARIDSTAERLIVNLARQLGGALELAATRRELALAARERRASRDQMIERGVDLLQVCKTCGLCFDHRQRACIDDGDVLSAPLLFPLCIGGRYRLLRRVGEGGMGTVFRARDLRLQRDVAVKVVRREHFDDHKVRLRFEQEARTVARIDHPGVISIFDSGELEDGALYLVMEWLEGHDLGQIIARDGPGTPVQVVEVLRQVCAALGAAQVANLVHRDIKPANIFVMPSVGECKVKLLDFGVAKDFNRDSQLTETGRLVGTPLYMSPEQFLGKPLDARSDLYSLASVAFLALTGNRIVKSTDLANILMETVTSECPKLSWYLPDVPPDVDSAFSMGLAKAPELRPESALEWLDEFAEPLSRVPPNTVGWRLVPRDSEAPATAVDPVVASIDVVFEDET